MQKSPTIASRAFSYLESVRYAVECRGAHSGREPHSKCIELALGAYYFPFT
jgi:hypothetical protein